jgi:glycosyltransferase involved in cell wall biosynthesis
VTSVVVPAHNEASVVGRLLDGLLDPHAPGALELVVVCNGCTDDTAAVARAPRGVVVLETPVPSKTAALRLGDEACSTFPRLYVDADVVLRAQDVERLTAALVGPVLAAAPARRVVLEGRPWAVRAYYRVWEQLPTVRDGLFGRGVIALSAEGHRLVAELPPVTADDLWLHHAFAPDQTRVVPEAVVAVHTPRHLADLVRRRLRVVSGAREVRGHPQAGPGTSGTGLRDLLDLARSRPDLWAGLAVFVLVTVVARTGATIAARRGARPVWHRDESSRTGG